MNPAMTARRGEAGFSLVELMVALLLSLVLLAGALSILYSSKLTNTENDRIARLQEAGRTVIELMLRDARTAGYPGCSRPLRGDEFANGLGNATTLLWNFELPVEGYEASGSSFLPGVGAMTLDTALTVPSPKAGSDIVAIRTTRQGQPVYRTTAAVSNVALPLEVTGNSATALQANTPMIISDCSGAAVFIATSFTAGTPVQIAHAAGTGNVTGDLARSGFGIGSLVMPIQTVIYYVKDSETSGVGPTLWQKVGDTAPQELVQGVENLQIRYGVDTDKDLLVNEYRIASAVTDWRDVVSMSVAVLVRSIEEAGVEKDNRKYDLLGTILGPFNDRRQRALFTTTVVFRNRTS